MSRTVWSRWTSSGMGISGTVSAFTGREPAAAASDEALRAMVSRSSSRSASPCRGRHQRPRLRDRPAARRRRRRSCPDLACVRSRIEIVRAVRALGASGAAVRSMPRPRRRDWRTSTRWAGTVHSSIISPRRASFAAGSSRTRSRTSRISRACSSTVSTRSPPPRVAEAGPTHGVLSSSIAVEDSTADLLEYALAKTMGEQLCAQMQKKMPRLKIVVARLPRTATRQTDTFLKVKSETAEAIMLSPIRTVQSHGDA